MDKAADNHVHRYRSGVVWSGATGVGYEHYERRHRWWVLGDDGTRVVGTEDMSNDPAFGGDATLVNPEQLVLVAAASCQLFSFLAVAARARIDVVTYADEAEATMPDTSGPMSLEQIVLHPNITVRSEADGKPTDERLDHLVEVAHRQCYIANSLRTPVEVQPTYLRTRASRERVVKQPGR